MKLLLAHDHRFLHDSGGQRYSVGSYPKAIWERYLRHFSSLTMLARDGGALGECDLAPSDHDSVNFHLLSKFSFVERVGLIDGPAKLTAERLVSAHDAVLVRLPSDLGLVVAHAAQKFGKPWLAEVVGSARDGYGTHGAALSRLYAPIAEWRTRKAVSRADFVLYVTQYWLQSEYPPSKEAIHDYASNVQICAMSKKDLLRREARLASIVNGSKPILGTVASLETGSKGLDLGLRALAKLRSEGHEFEWRILGPGNPTALSRMAQDLGVADQIRFDGTRSAGAGVAHWLDETDIYLQPSYQEGLPRGMVEAMSRGCIAIGSTAGGIPELLPAERLHQKGDWSRLAEIISAVGVKQSQQAPDFSHRDRKVSEAYESHRIDARRSSLLQKFAQAAARAA